MAEHGEQEGCGCKGIRSCLVCERSQRGIGNAAPVTPQASFPFIYSPSTDLAVGAVDSALASLAFHFPGVNVIKDFVSEEEECKIVQAMDQDSWKLSQSGRKKQDYGPKVNFKKQKLRVGGFSGLPSFSQDLVTRMQLLTALKGFLPVEQCNLDYNAERGSAIDPHLDDCWLWGERLVTLNLLSDTTLTMSCDLEGSLQLFPVFSHIVTELQDVPASTCQPNLVSVPDTFKLVPYSTVEVSISLPQRSLVVLAGDARYKWKHAIQREHVKHRRVCSTFRELAAEFRCGGKEERLGKELLKIALSFQGKPL
ncbi:alpha-ketoglutarate-dependent dioxygenase alkB homolog 4 [Microcaecilia unicolor]|uniref:Alpha-ketoglutarate-dependent dioxygenase alkB homolog 4 n=1 Tax=Microcaecilia unicolor TaxID=1415580 RepID=A0A6P8A0R5_9AMPH|nr:alpha-ketoglutarate-dependent dioxygenase alkB homolog 4 [Microcaecilia unicolor]